MKTPQEIAEQLKQPLEVSRVKKRQGGGGTSLSYIETHDAITALNRIFGFGGWKFTLLQFEAVPTAKGALYRQTVHLEINFGGEWIPREDVGIGIASNLNADQIEKGMKEAASDGLKRAARTLGEQFANSLYEKDAPEHRGEQRARLATSEQLQECEALRIQAVGLGFQVKGADPKKTVDGTEEQKVLAKIAAFRAFIQENGDKGGAPLSRLDSFLPNAPEEFLRFKGACQFAKQSFETDADVEAFENVASNKLEREVIIENLLGPEWEGFTEMVSKKALAWGEVK